MHQSLLSGPVKVAALNMSLEAALWPSIAFGASGDLPHSSSSRHVLALGFFPVAGSPGLLLFEATCSTKPFPAFSSCSARGKQHVQYTKAGVAWGVQVHLLHAINTEAPYTLGLKTTW